ncbi:phosphodiester glycosidase family protein [Chloroflexota bacterium]
MQHSLNAMMIILKRLLWICLTITTIAFAPVGAAAASTPDPPIPPGFYIVTSSIGVQLFQKDYSEGNPDFMQVIDLSEGASIELMHGDIAKPGTNRGDYGGDNPKFFSRSLKDYWRDFASENPNAFCVTNGSFFFMPEYPTKLAYPLRVDGKNVTDGFGIDHYPWNKLIFEIWDDRADIRRLSRWSLHTSSAPNIIAGLTEDANKKAKFYTGRTFVGVDDRNEDGDYEIVLFYNTLTARQVDAAQVLRSFGADQVMMLDGGGSTQLICQGIPIVKSDRFIPQTIAVGRGEGPSFAGKILDLPNFPILIEGEDVQVQIEIENTGAETWKADEVQILIDNYPWAANHEIALGKGVRPRESLVYSWTITPNSRGGVNTTNIFLLHAGIKYPIEPSPLNVIILPRKLVDRRVELETNLSEWSGKDTNSIVQLSNKWIQDQIEEPLPQIVVANAPENKSGTAQPLTAVIVIPITVVSLSALLFFGLRKKHG